MGFRRGLTGSIQAFRVEVVRSDAEPEVGGGPTGFRNRELWSDLGESRGRALEDWGFSTSSFRQWMRIQIIPDWQRCQLCRAGKSAESCQDELAVERCNLGATFSEASHSLCGGYLQLPG